MKEFERIRNLDTIYIKFDENLERQSRLITIDNNGFYSEIIYLFNTLDKYFPDNKDFNVFLNYYSVSHNETDTIVNKIKIDNKKRFKKYKKNCIDINFFIEYSKKTKMYNYLGCPKDFLWKKIYVIDFSETENNNLYMFPVKFSTLPVFID